MYLIPIKKILSGIPLLTKGPLALYYGGKDIIPLLSSATVKSTNIPFYFLLVLSPLLQLSLEIYKRYKFRKEILYEQQLQQAVMSGVRNVYSQIIVFMVFLACCACFAIHVYFAEKNKEIKNPDDPAKYSSLGPFIMIVIVSSINIMPFMNPKLRFVQFKSLNKPFILFQEILKEKNPIYLARFVVPKCNKHRHLSPARM